MAVSADTLRLAVAKETTAGVAATGAYDLIRTVGEGLTYTVNTTQSDEMGGLNRGVKDNILVGATVTGDINFELSKHVALENLLAAVHGNTWGGDPLTVPGSGPEVVYDASVMDTWTIEKRFTLDSTPTYDFHLFVGCMVDTLSISITPNEKITGSFGFIGNEMTTEGTEAGSSYAQAGVNPIMTAPLVTGIELLAPAGMNNTTGAPAGTPVAWSTSGCFTGLDLSFSNNGRSIACIGTLGSTETVLGRFQVTGTGTLYYAGSEPLDALLLQTEYGMLVTMSDADGESFEFFFPRVVFSEATTLATGTNTDVMTEFTLQILEHQGDSYAVTSVVTRSSAATAPALAAPAASSFDTE